MTDNDNKDPQITAEMVQKWLETFSSYEDMYDGTIDAADIARAYLKQATELKQVKQENTDLTSIIDDMRPKLRERTIELKQLRAENSNLREALAFGIKNPEIVRVIKSKLTDSAQITTDTEGK